MFLQASYKHLVVMGDFNADLLTAFFNSRQVLDFIDSSGLYLVPSGLTHYVRDAATLLDLCIMDDQSKLNDSFQCDVCFLSDHDLIGIKYSVNIPRRGNRTVFVRDFRSFDLEAFSKDFKSHDWNQPVSPLQLMKS